MSNIKIQEVDQRIQYSATAGQTSFAIPYPFFKNSDIVAYKDDSLMTITTDYTLSGAGSPSGGTLTLTSGATSGDIITIQGNMAIDRTSIYSATISNLTGSDLNHDFNREVVMMKQIETVQNILQLQYKPYLEVSQNVNVTRDRWLPILDPSQVWAMNPAGTEIIAVDFDNAADAPVDAHYFLAQPDGQLINGVNFGALSSGLLKHTVSAGKSTPARAVPAIDYWAPGNTLQTNTLLVEDDIQHVGNTNNKIAFGTSTQNYQTSGSTRLDISNDGLRIGGANARVTTILDQDSMASNSATALATQQSIKAYVDNQVTGSVTTVKGTASQVLVDGTTGTQQSGDVTLTLPQNIATSSSPTFSGGTLTNALNMSSNLINNLNEPVSASDAATKQYVDERVADIHFLQPVRVGSTANFVSTYDNATAGVGATLTASSNGAASIDGISLSSNDRVMFKDQTSTLENGLYYVSQVGDASNPAIYTRATDFDEPSEIVAGDLVTVLEGSTLDLTGWLQTADVNTIGTDPITFVQFSADFSNVVTIDGTQTVTGDKTFTGTTVVPTPSGGTESANKNYVDQKSGFVERIYTSSATWNKPAGFSADSFIEVWGVAGGGGSGGVPATGSGESAEAGGGGGGATFYKKIDNAALGSSETITIGAKGAAGPTGSGTGGTGGTTSFGSHATSTGGGGGSSSVATSGNANGQRGVGGTATGGDINLKGGDAQLGIVRSGKVTHNTEGGSSYFGQQKTKGGGGNGEDGYLYGGGAVGAISSASTVARPGGEGAPGLMIIREYF